MLLVIELKAMEDLCRGIIWERLQGGRKGRTESGSVSGIY